MRESTPTRTIGAAAVVLALLGIARPASAHALGVECKLHDGVVRLEAYFDDDTAAADARVVVLDAAQLIVAEGRTDAKGMWHFPAPPLGLYRVTIDAGAGHQTVIRLRIAVPAERTAAPEPVAKMVLDGPTRAEFTQFPWGKVALGLAAIVLLFSVWRGCRRWRQRSCCAPELTEIALPMSVSSPEPERKLR